MVEHNSYKVDINNLSRILTICANFLKELNNRLRKFIHLPWNMIMTVIPIAEHCNIKIYIVLLGGLHFHQRI